MSDLESQLESIAEAPAPKAAYKSILKIIEKCLNAAKSGKIEDIRARDNIWSTEVPLSAHALLIEVFRFKISADTGLWELHLPPGEAKGPHGGPSQRILDLMEGAQEMIKCMMLSLGDPDVNGESTKKEGDGDADMGDGGDKKDLNNADDEEEDPEMLAALALSLGDGTVVPEVQNLKKQKKSGNSPKKAKEGENDEEMARRMQDEGSAEEGGDDEKQQRGSVEFERFNDENVVIDPKQIDEVNEMQKALGEPYVDPQFPPSDKALYMLPEDAKTWQCGGCGNRNPLPPLFAVYMFR